MSDRRAVNFIEALNTYRFDPTLRDLRAQLTAPGLGGKQFIAFDKATGELLWTRELEARSIGVVAFTLP